MLNSQGIRFQISSREKRLSLLHSTQTGSGMPSPAVNLTPSPPSSVEVSMAKQRDKFMNSYKTEISHISGKLNKTVRSISFWKAGIQIFQTFFETPQNHNCDTQKTRQKLKLQYMTTYKETEKWLVVNVFYITAREQKHVRFT